MEAAEAGNPVHTDIIDQSCSHDVEYSDTSLQRGEGPQRRVGILSMCLQTGDDAFADSYLYECPND